MHEDNKIRNPHDPETEKARLKRGMELLQSSCNHKRTGILTIKKDRYLYCLDCLLRFPGKELNHEKKEEGKEEGK